MLSRPSVPVEAEADIILYGSRSRHEAGPESDWDFLILVHGPVGDARADAIRHRLYEIEWESGEVLCAIVRSREDRQNRQSPQSAGADLQ